MKPTTFLPLLLLFACTKNDKAQTAISAQAPGATAAHTPLACNFGLTQFNTSARAYQGELVMATKNSKTQPAPPPAPAVPNATILLDFDGQRVEHTYWNTNGVINAAPANLQASEVERIVSRVAEDFAPFNVTVTTDENLYNQTNPHKRMRVIVTETYQWYGIVGGISYPNSFQWGNNTPCFVFSTLLSYNEKWIAEAISHEVGHTLSLAHQASYNESGSMITEFNPGTGTGLTGWAPIMGSNYFQNITTWHKGRTPNGYATVQDDVAILTAILGKKPDEADATQKDELTVQGEGIINTSDDVDRWYIELKNEGKIMVYPSCLDNCAGANLDLQAKVYRKNGELVATLNDPSELSVTTRLPKGKYYLDLESAATAYQNRYGMLGTYKVLMEN